MSGLTGRAKLSLLTLAVAGLSYGDVRVGRNGVGTIGKGDVQSAFKWNNEQLQRNVRELDFTLHEEQTYRAVCTHVEADGTTSEETHFFTEIRESPILATATRNKQGHVTGFRLDGVDPAAEPAVTGDDVPEVGERCDSEGSVGTWTSVEPEGPAAITIKICFRDFCITIIIDL